MTTTPQTWTEETLQLAGSEVHMVKGGTGDPLLVLHGELGHPGWLKFHEALAQSHTLYIPSHPGFGRSEYQDWIMNMRDMAGWYLEAMDELGLGQVDVLGLSLGGWLAAEIATMCPHQFKKMVLVSSPGIKPPSGEILDMFLVVAQEYLTLGYLDPDNTPEFKIVCPDEPAPEQAELWEVSREEACRLTWRPYMYYAGLPRLLHRVRTIPSLIVWGRQDPIVPLSVGEAYNSAIQGSRLEVLDGCGHYPEVEKADEFVALVNRFLSQR